MKQETIDIIERNMQASFSGEYTFPQIVKNLIEAGIERYYTDLIGLQNIYYTTDGSFYTSKLPYSQPPKRGEIFSEKDVIDAVRTIQRGEIIYPEFLNRVLKAGTVSYNAFLLGRQVHYVGAKGEIYIEPFPQQVKNQ